MMIIGKLFKFYSFSVSIHKIIKETSNKQNKSHKFSISNKISPIGSFVVDKYSKIWSYEPFDGVNSDILSPKPSHSAIFPSFSNYFVPPNLLALVVTLKVSVCHRVSYVKFLHVTHQTLIMFFSLTKSKKAIFLGSQSSRPVKQVKSSPE